MIFFCITPYPLDAYGPSSLLTEVLNTPLIVLAKFKYEFSLI